MNELEKTHKNDIQPSVISIKNEATVPENS